MQVCASLSLSLHVDRPERASHDSTSRRLPARPAARLHAYPSSHLTASCLPPLHSCTPLCLLSSHPPCLTPPLHAAVAKCHKALGLGSTRVEAQLYKLLLYEKGSHFVEHRDTEKADGMFGESRGCGVQSSRASRQSVDSPAGSHWAPRAASRADRGPGSQLSGQTVGRHQTLLHHGCMHEGTWLCR